VVQTLWFDPSLIPFSSVSQHLLYRPDTMSLQARALEKPQSHDRPLRVLYRTLPLENQREKKRTTKETNQIQEKEETPGKPPQKKSEENNNKKNGKHPLTHYSTHNLFIMS